MLQKHIQKENLHHAYLLSGDMSNILENLFSLFSGFGIKIQKNPDFHLLSYDTLKIDDARAIKNLAENRSFDGSKKLFVISVNNFLPESQNTLLKIFEEPKENMHFFIISKNVDSFLPTLRSRCYLINLEQDKNINEEIEKFLNISLQNKIDYVKNLLDTDEDKGEPSARTEALEFLDQIESALHNRMSKMPFDTDIFHKIFTARKYIRGAGSSPKNILEAIVLNLPEKV